VLIGPDRLLTTYLCGTEALSLGHDAYILAERSIVWADGAQISLHPRLCLIGNTKAGFMAVAMARPAPRSLPLPLPSVEPWPVSEGEQLCLYLHSDWASSLLARTRAIIRGGEAASRVAAVALSIEGATLRFRAAERIAPIARGAPVLNDRGEWVGLMYAACRFVCARTAT